MSTKMFSNPKALANITLASTSKIDNKNVIIKIEYTALISFFINTPPRIQPINK